MPELDRTATQLAALDWETLFIGEAEENADDRPS